MTQEMERRYFAAEELRFEQSESGSTVTGYAAVYDRPSEVLTTRTGVPFREVISKGAFRSILSNAGNVPLLVEHEGLPLADTATGTLTLSEDAGGLRFVAALDETDPDVQRVIPKLRRGTLRSMSFGFKVAPRGQSWDHRSAPAVRHLHEFDALQDVSIVARPAYPDTTVALRSLEDAAKDEPKAEDESAEPKPAPQRELRRRRLRLSE